MPTLREVRSRISGVKKTQKITKAMKMVAAAKLRRAQRASWPHVRMHGACAVFCSIFCRPWNREANRFLLRVRFAGSGVIVVTSDRGLCGAFNANIIRATHGTPVRRDAGAPQAKEP